MTTAIRRGNTPTAAYINQASQRNREYFDCSAVLSKNPARDELLDLWNECKFSNWDGYDAFAVDPKTLTNAFKFIKTLPLGYDLPSVGAEPDGHITLEWYKNKFWVLSVSISPEGKLYYAALLGTEDKKGSELFFEDIPSNILRLIDQVK